MNNAGHRGSFLRRSATITWTGTTSGSQDVVRVTTPLFFQAGTYTILVDQRLAFSFVGMAAGGAGRPSAGGGSDNGGGGGGSGSYTTDTPITLVPGKTYTLTVPGVATSGNAGSSLTFVNTTDATTLVSLGGGLSGGISVVGAAGGTAVTGSNLVNGKTGGTGSTEAVGGNTNGVADAAGAGSGSGGNSGDGLGTGNTGGAGKDEAGQVGGTTGGHGGGTDFNGTKCGGGGGGGYGAAGGVAGSSEPGGAKFLTFVASPGTTMQSV